MLPCPVLAIVRTYTTVPKRYRPMKTRRFGLFLLLACWFGAMQISSAHAQDTDFPPPINEALAPETVAERVAVSDARDPVRVLAVTTTHGFRHSSIDAIHEVLPALARTTEFEFDITEDLALLTEDNLAEYDLLLFANATIRVRTEAQAGDESSEAAIYGFTFQTLEGAIEASFSFENLDSDAPSGSVLTAPGAPPIPLEDFQYDPPMLSFSFDTQSAYGHIYVSGELTPDAFDSEWRSGLGDSALPIAATRLNPEDTGVPDGMTEEQREAVRAFLASGKGIAGAHAALDALYGWDWYREMAGGGLFKNHPWTQSVRIRIEEPDHPAVAHFGDGFQLHDEIYVLDANPRWNVHVLASLDMQSVGVDEGPASTLANDYPVSWLQEYGGGRVFYTTLGHFEDVWTTPAFVEHLLQGMRIAAGRLDANMGDGKRAYEVLAEDVWPDDIAVDDNGHVWIAELRGKIHRYDADTGETRQIAHLDGPDPTNVEHGLLGIEVDPAFYEGEPYVYLFYTEPKTFTNTLSRFTYRDDMLDLSSEKVLLRVPTEPQCCHQAGDIEWGPDGSLYLSTGDTGMSEVRPQWEIPQERIDAFMARHDLARIHWTRLVDSERSAQNLQDLRGKILRIHKDGSIPKDNPFFGQPGVRWEIYAYGLRNPYRFKVDHETGALYIGVVGPDAGFDYDEYNISETGGENFGWPRNLGKLFYNEITPEHIPDFVPPIWEYTYESGGRSATVGPIYRHEGAGGFPNLLQNGLFVYDWSRRWIKWGRIGDGVFESDVEQSAKNTPLALRLPTKRLLDIKTFDVLTRTAPISMETGPDGSIYVAEFDGFWNPGPNARLTRYRWIPNTNE